MVTAYEPQPGDWRSETPELRRQLPLGHRNRTGHELGEAAVIGAEVRF